MSEIEFNINSTKGRKAVNKIFYCEGNIDGTVGGSYYLLFDLVTHLNREKFQPVVAFHKDNILVPKLRDAGIETYIFKKPGSVSFNLSSEKSPVITRFIARLMLPVQKLINFFVRFVFPGIKHALFLKKNKIDMVNLNNSIERNHDWMLAAKLAGIKCLTHEMGINNEFSYTSRLLGRQLKGIICLSYAISNNMKRCGLHYPNVITIHCGIDLHRLHIKQSREELKKICHIDEQSPIIGVVGNIKEWKGQETVVRAVALLKKKWPNIKCFLVGDVSEEAMNYKEKLVDLCNEFSINDNIIFTGFQQNPVDYMNLMDVVIHSSIFPEPFGIVLLEAMSVKKPIVSTNIGAPPEVIVNGKTGLLVTPGEPDSLARAVEFFLSNSSQAKEMGQAGYERLNQDFTLKQNIDRTEAFYDQVLLSRK